MSSVCVVCTRARALITDRDRRHRHAVLCTLLLLRRLRTQHPPRCRRCLRSRGFAPSPPLLLALEAPPWPLAAVAACARARGFSIAAVAACARGSSLAAVGPFLSLFSRVCGFFGAPRSCCCDLITAVAGASSPSSPFFLSYLISPSWASLSALIYIIQTVFCFITFEL